MADERVIMDPTQYQQVLNWRIGQNDGFPASTLDFKEFRFEIEFEHDLYSGGGVPTMKTLIYNCCLFTEKVFIGFHRKAGDIVFRNCIFEKAVTIHSLDNVGLQGKNHFLDNADIWTGKYNNTIENIAFDRYLFVHGEGNLNFQGIHSDLEKPTGEIDLKNNFEIVVLNDVKIISCGSGYKASVTELCINRCSIDRLDMHTVQFRSNCSITGSRIDQLSFFEKQPPDTTLEVKTRSHIGRLIYHLSSFERLLFQDSEIDHLELFGENAAENTVKLETLTVRELVFRDVRNNGLVALQQVTIPPSGLLQVTASNLGKTDFILCEFTGARFDFVNSKLLEAFMARTNFPRHIAPASGVNYEQEQLAFGQISAAYQKQGDTVRYLEYQAREIEAHWGALRWFPRGWRSFSFTKLSLLLNKASNDFGRNWGRGLLFSFVTGLLFYYFLIISSREFHIGWPTIDGRLVSAFFRYMNPLRFFETENLFKGSSEKPFLTLQPLSYAIDFFARIVLAYGYYQTIQAFRRFGRKS